MLFPAQGSLQLAMDAIFARLDLAYAYHASTCEFMPQTLDHFRQAVDVGHVAASRTAASTADRGSATGMATGLGAAGTDKGCCNTKSNQASGSSSNKNNKPKNKKPSSEHGSDNR